MAGPGLSGGRLSLFMFIGIERPFFLAAFRAVFVDACGFVARTFKEAHPPVGRVLCMFHGFMFYGCPCVELPF